VFDDLTFTPRGDLDALVVSVMERGRLRRLRRRATTGAVAALVVFVAAGISVPLISHPLSRTGPNISAPTLRQPGTTTQRVTGNCGITWPIHFFRQIGRASCRERV